MLAMGSPPLPSLQIGSDASFSVRGGGTLAFAGTIDTSVALAVDDVKMGRPVLGTPLLMDLEGVEVLNIPVGDTSALRLNALRLSGIAGYQYRNHCAGCKR
jgi:iron complex outermembrane recepter protein